MIFERLAKLATDLKYWSVRERLAHAHIRRRTSSAHGRQVDERSRGASDVRLRTLGTLGGDATVDVAAGWLWQGTVLLHVFFPSCHTSTVRPPCPVYLPYGPLAVDLNRPCPPPATLTEATTLDPVGCALFDIEAVYIITMLYIQLVHCILGVEEFSVLGGEVLALAPKHTTLRVQTGHGEP